MTKEYIFNLKLYKNFVYLKNNYIKFSGDFYPKNNVNRHKRENNNYWFLFSLLCAGHGI